MMDYAELDREIQQKIDQSVLYHSTLGRDQLDARIEKLEGEWDLDRWLVSLMGGMAVASLLTGGLRKGRWALLGGVLGGFMLTQPPEDHPVLMFFRSLGIRTRTEIEREKFALKSLRGDMDAVREDLHDALSHAMHELDHESDPTVAH